MLIEEIRLGESESIEWKRELPAKADRYLKTVVAFANTSGGKLVFGIDDQTREIVGVAQDQLPALIDGITNAISDAIVPQLIPAISTADADGKSVLIVEIFPGTARPYYISSLGVERGTFVRINATTRPADAAMLKELQLQGNNLSYDKTILPGREVNDAQMIALCEQISDRVRSELEKKGESAIYPDVTPTNLVNWGVIKQQDGKLYPTIAFDLLTTNTQRFARIQCGAFKGTDKVVFLDKREFGGSIQSQIEEAYRFVLKHINLGARVDGLFRRERYELPPAAIREAIANAVTHRNYMDHACIQVCLFDDRLEITSPGMLFGGLTIDMIKNGRTRIRNAGVAEVFSRMYVIEGWGTGIRRMIGSCREYGVPEPEFQEIGSDFRVIFYRAPKREISGMSLMTTDSVTEAFAEAFADKLTETFTEDMLAELSETDMRLLLLINAHERMNTTQMGETIGISRTAVSNHLRKLKQLGILIREGSDRKGRWKINS